MSTCSRKHAFTLIELLVVVAIIALLLSILLPSLSGAREAGKRAKCLASLSNLGKAMAQYASEDRVEQIIPIQENMLRSVSTWEHDTVNWFAWGGRNGQQLFKTSPAAGIWLSDDPNMPDGAIARPTYAANRRPLNRYMLADIGAGDDRRLDVFECPSDHGYPDNLWVDDSPIYNAERRCYDTLGNSYRALLTCFYYAGSADFAVGPWGHRASTLQDTGRQVLFGDPSWFNMLGSANNDGGGGFEAGIIEIIGWHKRKMADNVAFADGSARLTNAELKTPLTSEEVEAMGVDPGSSQMIRRTGTYRMDVYPVPGAIIWQSNSEWLGYLDSNLWPWRGAQDNLRPQ